MSLADREDCDDTQKEHAIKTRRQCNRVQRHRESDGNAYTVRRGQRFDDDDDDDKVESNDFDVVSNDDNVDEDVDDQ